MANLIPEIGASGIYTLATPFNNVLMANVSYTCIAIRRLDDIVAAGADPQALYYNQPFQIDPARYTADLAAGVCIVSLQSKTGEIVYVPSSYIASFPSAGGVPYTTVALAVSLSAIPNSLDLSFLKQQITDLVQSTLGVTSTIHEMAISPMTLIDTTTHQSIEAARQANITNNQTDRAKLLAAQTALQSMQQKVTELENYIMAQTPAT